MWEMRTAHPLGRLSMRKLLTFVATLVVTLFAYLLVSAPTAQAATPDATWKQGSISYQDHTYTGPTKAKSGDGHELPADTVLYTYLEAPVPFASQKMHVIYFTAGSDPSTAATGSYVTYDRGPTGGLSNKSKPVAVTFKDTSKPDPGSATSDKDSGAGESSCKVDSIGWIVCPVTNFLAQGMDWVFGILSGFMNVQPLATSSTDTNVMMRVWDTMRGIANIAFVIAFLIIIYSQLTSTGVTNYGIKKLLPRLIIAAILVNVSFWICAVAIDISNILGYSIQDIFIGFRNNILGNNGNSWNLVSWESISGFILSGGVALGAGITGLTVAATTLGAFSVGGVMLLLLPILLGALLTILVVLLILSARQAIIVILVIIAPLAFVAYLLPNTEKWFEKWRGLFMTMLIFFPAFSLVFGGAQFAGIVIIQNAQNINMLLLGMAVQIAPLAITPLLLRLSGNLLGKIAGIVNNPSKGLLDRTKNWSKERLDARRALENARTRKMAANGQLRRRHAVRRTAMHFDNEKRLREGMKAANETTSTALFDGSKEGVALHEYTHNANQTKERIEKKLERDLNIKAMVDPELAKNDLELRVLSDEANLSKTRLDNRYENVKTGTRVSLPFDAAEESSLNLFNRASDSNTHLALEAMRKRAAEHVQEHNTTQTLLHNSLINDGLGNLVAAREFAGGIRRHEGANTALTTAVAHDRKEYADQVAEKTQLIRHFNLSSEQRQDLALGTDIAVARDGVRYIFEKDDEYSREAAIEDQLKNGSESQRIEIIKESGSRTLADGTVVQGKTYDYRTTIGAGVPANGIQSKIMILGSRIIDDIGQGRFLGEESLQNAAVFHIMEGKISDDVLAVQGTNSLRYLYESWGNRDSIPEYVNASPEKKAAFEANYQALRRSATKILEDPVNRNASEASRQIFNQYKVPPEEMPEDVTES